MTAKIGLTCTEFVFKALFLGNFRERHCFRCGDHYYRIPMLRHSGCYTFDEDKLKELFGDIWHFASLLGIGGQYIERLYTWIAAIVYCDNFSHLPCFNYYHWCNNHFIVLFIVHCTSHHYHDTFYQTFRERFGWMCMRGDNIKRTTCLRFSVLVTILYVYFWNRKCWLLYGLEWLSTHFMKLARIQLWHELIIKTAIF